MGTCETLQCLKDAKDELLNGEVGTSECLLLLAPLSHGNIEYTVVAAPLMTKLMGS
jgi:hypothetical protein